MLTFIHPIIQSYFPTPQCIYICTVKREFDFKVDATVKMIWSNGNTCASKAWVGTIPGAPASGRVDIRY